MAGKQAITPDWLPLNLVWLARQIFSAYVYVFKSHTHSHDSYAPKTIEPTHEIGVG